MKKKNSTFKAAVLFNLKKPLKIININYPDKLKKGQIFIHLKSSSICGAQANEINGIKVARTNFLWRLLDNKQH